MATIPIELVRYYDHLDKCAHCMFVEKNAPVCHLCPLGAKLYMEAKGKAEDMIVQRLDELKQQTKQLVGELQPLTVIELRLILDSWRPDAEVWVKVGSKILPAVITATFGPDTQGSDGLLIAGEDS